MKKFFVAVLVAVIAPAFLFAGCMGNNNNIVDTTITNVNEEAKKLITRYTDALKNIENVKASASTDGVTYVVYMAIYNNTIMYCYEENEGVSYYSAGNLYYPYGDGTYFKINTERVEGLNNTASNFRRLDYGLFSLVGDLAGESDFFGIEILDLFNREWVAVSGGFNAECEYENEEYDIDAHDFVNVKHKLNVFVSNKEFRMNDDEQFFKFELGDYPFTLPQATEMSYPVYNYLTQTNGWAYEYKEYIPDYSNEFPYIHITLNLYTNNYYGSNARLYFTNKIQEVTKNLNGTWTVMGVTDDIIKIRLDLHDDDDVLYSFDVEIDAKKTNTIDLNMGQNFGEYTLTKM